MSTDQKTLSLRSLLQRYDLARVQDELQRQERDRKEEEERRKRKRRDDDLKAEPIEFLNQGEEEERQCIEEAMCLPIPPATLHQESARGKRKPEAPVSRKQPKRRKVASHEPEAGSSRSSLAVAEVKVKGEPEDAELEDGDVADAEVTEGRASCKRCSLRQIICTWPIGPKSITICCKPCRTAKKQCRIANPTNVKKPQILDNLRQLLQLQNEQTVLMKTLINELCAREAS